MKFTLHIWRQADANASGGMVTYEVEDISGDMSFLEMLDQLNESLVTKGEDPIAFDHDCREGICGMCSLVINGASAVRILTNTAWAVDAEKGGCPASIS